MCVMDAESLDPPPSAIPIQGHLRGLNLHRCDGKTYDRTLNLAIPARKVRGYNEAALL